MGGLTLPQRVSNLVVGIMKKDRDLTLSHLQPGNSVIPRGALWLLRGLGISEDVASSPSGESRGDKV